MHILFLAFEFLLIFILSNFNPFFKHVFKLAIILLFLLFFIINLNYRLFVLMHIHLILYLHEILFYKYQIFKKLLLFYIFVLF